MKYVLLLVWSLQGSGASFMAPTQIEMTSKETCEFASFEVQKWNKEIHDGLWVGHPVIQERLNLSSFKCIPIGEK